MKKTTSVQRKILIGLTSFSGFIAVLLFLLVVVIPLEDTTPIPSQYFLVPGEDPWDFGWAAYQEGDFEQAAAYWKQIPEDHPQYSRSLRYLGWELQAGEFNEPRKALGYVHQSVLEAPFDGNTWQDLGRTYGALLGFN
jgi:tetratricopeptide (TPR) repeat protein